MNSKIIFFDFDGTLTSKDTLDLFFELNVEPKKLQEISSLWESGVIGSKKCLTDLFALCKNISIASIHHIVDNIAISEDTLNLLKLLKEKGFTICIVSDGVDLIIDMFLKKHGIQDYFDNIYSNSLKIKNEKAFFIQNYSDKNICLHNIKCALCKSAIIESVIKENKGVSQSFYIGDVLSDLHGALKCDYVFAKNGLFDILPHKKKILFYSFSTIIKFFDTF